MEKINGEDESKKFCSCSCCSGGRSRHCGSKTIIAIVLILLGWICGYLMGTGSRWCPKNKYISCLKGAESPTQCPLTGNTQAPASTTPAN